VRTAILFGLSTLAASALFFACAKGDEGVAADAGEGTGPGADGGNGDAAPDGNTNYGGKDAAGSGDGSIDDDGGTEGGPTVCVESDAGCLTGSPGACSAGIIHCSDAGAPVCVATVTTESCYSGGVSTRNIGICHDGTQTCTGTLGACTSEVDPAAHEDCFNNTDDDCNGLINDGCPTSLSIGASSALASAGTGTGGGPHNVVCPAGAFVSRVDSWFDDSDGKASGVSIYCATPSLIQGGASYSVTLAANTPAPYLIEHGSSDPAVERSDDCGISGLTAIVRSDGRADTHVEAQGYHCGTSAVTLNADNTINFDFVTNGDTSFNAYPGATQPAYDRLCPFFEVLVGFTVRDGAYMDNITPLCAPLDVDYSAGTADP
jgi:hypothetical protein